MHVITWFDNRTILSCQMLLAMVFAAVFFAVRRTYPGLRGVAFMALSFLFGVPATFLLSSRGVLPDVLSAVVANCLVFTSFSLYYVGINRFLGNDRPIYPVVIASVLTVAIVAFYNQAQNNIVPRIVAISFTIGLIRGLIALELFRHAAGRNTIRLFALSMTVFSVMSFSRALGTFLHGAPANYLERDSIQTFTLAAGLVSICLTGLFFLLMCNSQALSLARNESEIDTVSGAFNRRGIEVRLNIELNRAGRSRERLSIALIDIDHFKSINDSAGHAAGDAAIRGIVEAATTCLRAYDFIGRFGGDEFVLLLPQTRCSDAQMVSDRLALYIRSTVSSGTDRPLTLSIGLTEAVQGDTLSSLLARADKALYAAKHAGRSCSRSVLHDSQNESVQSQDPIYAS